MPAIEAKDLERSQDPRYPGYYISHRKLAEVIGCSADALRRKMSRLGFITPWTREERTSPRQGRYTVHYMWTIPTAKVVIRRARDINDFGRSRLERMLNKAWAAKVREDAPPPVVHGRNWPESTTHDQTVKDLRSFAEFTFPIDPASAKSVMEELSKHPPKLTLAPEHTVTELETRLELNKLATKRVAQERDTVIETHLQTKKELEAAYGTVSRLQAEVERLNRTINGQNKELSDHRAMTTERRARIKALEEEVKRLSPLGVVRPMPIPEFRATGRYAKRQWLSYQNSPYEIPGTSPDRGTHANHLLEELGLLKHGLVTERGKLYSRVEGIHTVWEQGLGPIVRGLDVA